MKRLTGTRYGLHKAVICVKWGAWSESEQFYVV